MVIAKYEKNVVLDARENIHRKILLFMTPWFSWEEDSEPPLHSIYKFLLKNISSPIPLQYFFYHKIKFERWFFEGWSFALNMELINNCQIMWISHFKLELIWFTPDTFLQMFCHEIWNKLFDCWFYALKC